MPSERMSTSCPLQLLENRPGTTDFPSWQLQKNSGIVPMRQPILYYWSGFIGSLCCSQIFTMIDTDTTLPLCMIPAKGIMWGTRRYSSECNYIMLTPPGKGHLLKQSSCRHSWIGQPGHPLVDSCTRQYWDWTKDFPAPTGSKNTLEEHFVWLSTNYQPYTHDPGSPFIPPDFILGLPPVWDWPRRSGEPPWPLDPKDHPKPKPDLVAPADSTGASSQDESKQQRKKKKHRRPRKAELKVTTRGLGTDDPTPPGLGTDDPVWTNTGSARSSSSTASSHSGGRQWIGVQPPGYWYWAPNKGSSLG